MIRNYLKISLRFIKRNRLFASVNILGLSLSLACVIMLFMYSMTELSYEKHQDPSVYRIHSTLTSKEGSLNIATSSIPVGPTSRDEIPEIASQTRVMMTTLFGATEKIRYEEESFEIEDGSAADSTLFDVLKFHFISGNSETALNDRKNIVLSQETVVRLFGEEDPLGKTVTISFSTGTFDFEVSGVIDNSYYKSDYKPNYIISFNSEPFSPFAGMPPNWVGNNLVFTYLLLNDGADPELTTQKLNEVLMKYGGETMKELGFQKEMSLANIYDLHFDPSVGYDMNQKTSLTYLRVIMTIAMLILVLACVNYVNLSTAQAGQRAREVGVRKVMGVTKGTLRFQFLFESFLTVTVAILFSLLLVEFLLPSFNQLANSDLSVTANNIGQIVLSLFGFLIITVFLAGAYPAYYLSQFRPVDVLKTNAGVTSSGGFLRKILVIFQFIISITLITGIIIITQQFDFIKNKDKGFNTDSKIVLKLSSQEELAAYFKLKNEISQLTNVKGVSGASSLPGHITSDMPLFKEGQTMDDAKIGYVLQVDHNYVPFMDHELLSGRNFSENWEVDREAQRIIINEHMAAQYEWSAEEAIGEILSFDWQGGIHLEFEIIGVLKDFNFFSLHRPVEPMVYTLTDNTAYSHLYVHFVNTDFSEVTALIEGIWKENLPGIPYEPTLMDDNIMQQYETDQATYQIVLVFAILSIIISCLGLYALSVFIAERKFKEIGVRKALGASLTSIVFLVSSNLYKMIIIAFILSVPLVYYGSNKWLESFEYKIEISIWSFVVAGFVSLLIAWITTSYQSIRAARTNPADVLKSE